MRASGRFNVAGAAVALALLGSVGCAPSGQGDPCTPEAIPSGGFSPREVYVETSSVQCRTRICMVYHLSGNPECEEGISPHCPTPATASAECTSAGGSLCVTSPVPDVVSTNDNALDRVFCTCRCSAGGNPSLPLCRCTDGFRCVPDADPGGGYCVPNELAIAQNICVSTDECTGGRTCDPTTHHCI